MVARATATAAELTAQELDLGGAALRAKVLARRPAVLAVLGVTAYRSAFGSPRAALGPQPSRVGETTVWVLPNPSGLNAHYTPTALAELFTRLRGAVERSL